MVGRSPAQQELVQSGFSGQHLNLPLTLLANALRADETYSEICSTLAPWCPTVLNYDCEEVLLRQQPQRRNQFSNTELKEKKWCFLLTKLAVFTLTVFHLQHTLLIAFLQTCILYYYCVLIYLKCHMRFVKKILGWFVSFGKISSVNNVM